MFVSPATERRNEALDNGCAVIDAIGDRREVLFGKTGTQSGGGCVSRLRHAADDGGGGATFPGGEGAARATHSGISWRTTRRTSSGRGVRCTTPSSRASRFWWGWRCRIRSRRASRRGGTFRAMFLHALWRSLLLVALGVFLRSTHAPQTYYTFEDTLSQIGLGLPDSVPAGVPSAAVAVGGARCAAFRLLAGVGVVSGAGGGILLGLRGALEQGEQFRQRIRPSGS